MSDEHIKRTYIVEDSWKCESCGEANPGRFLRCQKCGTPKDKSTADTTNLDAAEVADPELLKLANAGANWVCKFCGSQDRAADGRCRNCGAKQDEGRGPDSPGGAGVGAPPPVTQAPTSKSHLKIGVAVGGAAIAVVLVALVMPHKKSVTVASTHWQYTAELDQRSVEHDSGFSWPADAFNKSCETRQNGTHDCNPYACNPHSESYKCNPHDCNCHKESTSKKNGFSEVREVCSTCYDSCSRTVESTCYQQCPTYAQWCSYDHYVWHALRTQTTEGDGPQTHWPDLEAQGPDTRLQRSEKYQVAFQVGEKEYQFAPKSLDEFQHFTRGANWTVKVNVAGQVWPVEPAH